MIKIKIGNILNCNENIIVHQVNIQGIMGGGLARQLADHYHELEDKYAEHCKELLNNYDMLKGSVFFYRAKDKKVICNMFSQEPNFNTDYVAMEKAFKYIKKWAENNNLSIAIPYKIGCGIANGDWNIVYKIIKEVFSDYDVTLYKLKED